MKGIILAAGFGTRFRPVTYLFPKPVLPLCNRPIIGYAMEAMLSAGIRDIAVNLHHLPDELEAAVTAEFGSRCRLHFSREASILGTGGAIRRLGEWIGDAEDFVLMNGDTVQQPPLAQMIEKHLALRPLATLLLRKPPAGDRFTPVILHDGRVIGFGETDSAGERLMFAGAHVISSSILQELPDRDFSGITEDVYFRVAIANESRIAAVVGEGVWFDVGSPARYLLAHNGVLSAMKAGSMGVPADSRIDGDALLDLTAEVHGFVSGSAVGPSSRIGPGSRVEGSAIWGDVVLDEGAHVVDSILCRGVRVPRGQVIRRSLVMVDDSSLELPSGGSRANGLITVPIPL